MNNWLAHPVENFLTRRSSKKRHIKSNWLTFTKLLDESLNNQSYRHNSASSLKIGFHILRKKLNIKYKCSWCFPWLSLVELGVSNFISLRPKIVLLPPWNKLLKTRVPGAFNDKSLSIFQKLLLSLYRCTSYDKLAWRKYENMRLTLIMIEIIKPLSSKW